MNVSFSANSTDNTIIEGESVVLCAELDGLLSIVAGFTLVVEVELNSAMSTGTVSSIQ